MKLREQNNLYRLVAQTLEWIFGHTGIEYELLTLRLARNDGDGTTPVHWAFDIKTNHSRTKQRHPLALCIEEVHVVMTGVVTEIPDTITFPDGERVTEFEIEDMLRMPVTADQGGYSTVAVQFKMNMLNGGEEIFTRHFLFRNNLLHTLR